MSKDFVTVVGAGLAGCEAAWQLARRKCPVILYEMKPKKRSPAHESDDLSELVCSNSFRSADPHSAVGLLKDEMRKLGSLIMKTADENAVPAGKALAVDRELFAKSITEAIEAEPLVTVARQEITQLPDRTAAAAIIATGPLTSEPLTESLAAFTGAARLYFYDAIAPILHAESLDLTVIYQKSRYDDGPGDYLNCPLSEHDYYQLVKDLNEADYAPLHDFEEIKYFEGCLPIEVMSSRGPETLRYGPLKPVGLENPRTGQNPYAVVQLRKENEAGTLFNMVGFQTKMTQPEQKRIFRKIPGLQSAEFARFGSIHRNTFICAPEILEPTLQTRRRPDLLIAGQLSGVEGYVESTAMGLLAGINAARIYRGERPLTPPPETALGAMISHLTESAGDYFQPSNINFGLFPAWEKKVPKRQRGQIRAQRSAAALMEWIRLNRVQH